MRRLRSFNVAKQGKKRRTRAFNHHSSPTSFESAQEDKKYLKGKGCKVRVTEAKHGYDVWSLG